ncbi:hypothetical protein B1R94_27035 [Mycolicibacterium litorale]|nr:hypothetical protein B1R94_27035 [Mycolicibacterium litorale]
MTAGKPRARLVDVARLANVSVTTASRALNGHGEMTEATRQLVLDCAAQLGFRPSTVAQSLRTQRSTLIGMIVPHIEHAFYAALVKGVQRFLEPKGYALLLIDAGEEAKAMESAIRTLLDQQVAGLLIATTSLQADQFRAEFRGTPCIFIDEFVEDAGEAAVAIENALGIDLLVAHIVDHGHNRVGYIGGDPRRTDGGERRDGFLGAAQRYQLDLDTALVKECGWELDSGIEAALQLLTGPKPPTAIVTASIELALGVLTAAASIGVDIPSQLALATFDDTYFTPLLQVPLTVVAYDAVDMGHHSAELLLDAISGELGERAGQCLRVPVTLIRRRSCGCLYSPIDELKAVNAP